MHTTMNARQRFALVLALASVALATFAGASSALACVVGSGTSAGCTEAALNACLPGGARFDGTVTFACGGPKTIAVSDTKIVNADCTIDGGSLITLDGGTANGMFVVTADVMLALDNVTVSRGTTAGAAGAVFNANRATLIVRNSRFLENGARNVSDGGAIFNLGTAILTDSTFLRNHATRSGGAVFNSAGATLIVTGSSFSANSADLDGGAIRNDGRMTVSASGFFDNAAGRDGGAIFAAADVTITTSAFARNSARSDGGAILNDAGALTVVNCTFSANAANLGGAVDNRRGTPTVTNCTFSGNRAATDGGGVFNGAAMPLTLINTILAGSSSGGNCGRVSALGLIVDGGHNIDDDGTCGFTGANCAIAGTSFCKTDPRLDAAGLASNGGPTPTIALEADSPAIDAGDETVCAAPPVGNLDQRGFIRPGGVAASCSIGAYEFDAVPPITTTSTTTTSSTSTTSTTVPGCAAMVLDHCKTLQTPANRPLRISVSLSPGKNRLVWKWKNGAATAFAELGDPTRTTSYGLCIYETGRPTPVLEALAAAGGICRDVPCWKVIPKKAVRYRDRSGSSNGLVRVTVHTGRAGRAAIVVRAAGPKLPLPSLPLLAPVTVQLQTSDGVCWETSDSTSPSRRSAPGRRPPARKARTREAQAPRSGRARRR